MWIKYLIVGIVIGLLIGSGLSIASTSLEHNPIAKFDEAGLVVLNNQLRMIIAECKSQDARLTAGGL